MTFSALIKSNSWQSIQIVLLQLYPDEQEFIDEYEKVVYGLKIMQPLPGKITIDVEWILDTYDDTHYVDVSGYYTNPAERTDEHSNSLAFEFVPWNEWLGMPFDENSVKNYTELELIAHCLHEMTYAGFEQEEIQSEFDKIKGIKEEYDSLSKVSTVKGVLPSVKNGNKSLNHFDLEFYWKKQGSNFLWYICLLEN